MTAAASEYASISHGSTSDPDLGMTDLIHVVNKEGQFCTTPDAITKFMNKHGLLDCGIDYSVIAIMGAQSSGKSTLLNILFGTKFEELNSQSGRQMTTKGVWFGASPLVPHALIMDLEGTDSVTRGQERHPFERQSALLALSVAEVLIINMWQHDIGRYVASNYGVLATVFEVNISLLAEQLRSGSNPNKTLLLFSIRDHSESESPLHIIAGQLRQDMQRIWSELKLPLDLSQLTMESLFEIQFVGLPHKKYESDLFRSAVDQLRTRFVDPKCPDYLFSAESRLQKTVSVPASGLGKFVGTIWDTIVNHKDLNLPSQKEMLAIYRCDEEMAGIIAEYHKAAASLKKGVDLGFDPDFAPRCNSIISSCLQTFDENLSGYHPTVVRRKRDDLLQKIHVELKPLWAQLMTQAKAFALALYKTEMDSQLPKQKASSRFNEISKQCSQLAQQKLMDLRTQALPETCNWPIDQFISQLNVEIDGIQTSLREQQLVKLSGEVLAKARSQLIPQAIRSFELASPSMWQDIQSALDEWLADITENVIERKLPSIDNNPQRCKQFQEISKQDAIAQLKEEAKKYVGFLKQKMQKTFDLKFRLDDQGLPRIWHQERDIRAHYLRARNNAEQLLTLFNRFRLSETAPEGSPRASSFRKAAVLLSDSEMDSIRESFHNDCQMALEAAETNALRARQLSHIPLWIYALIGILGANEAITILSHPFLFMLIIFTLIVLGVIYYLNLSQPAYALARMFAQQASTQMFGALNEYQPANVTAAVPKQGFARKRSPAHRKSPARESESSPVPE